MNPYTIMYNKLDNKDYDPANFYEDLLAAYELKNNEKSRKAYSLAYDYGHSYGIFEMLSYFDDLVELIK